MLHCTVCFYCSMTELATCHCFLVTGQLYWVKILVPQPKPMKVQSHDFRCQRKVLSLCHPFLNMPYFFILFSSPLYYILFCAQLIVLTSFWSSSSPFPLIPFILFTQAIPFCHFSSTRSHPHPSIYPDSCFQTPEPKAYFTGSGFPLLVLGGGRSDWHKPSKSSINERVGGEGGKLTQ